jgi:UDP-2,4-diacetamido-2,4,6-trideoxy-beta-L-altropyranose hydrolase
MNIVIRTDASLLIGSGHVMRCLVLANAMTLQGYCVSFVMRPQAGDLISFVTQQGYKVMTLPVLDLQQNNDQTQDAEAVCAVLSLQQKHTVHALLVDHYALGKEWETTVAHALGCKILVLDDLERAHNADLVVDQTIHRSKNSYALTNIHPNGVNATGAQFALLKPEFAHRRRHILFENKTYEHASSRILVAMGGVDQDNVTLTVLKALVRSATSSSITVTVLMSRQSPHFATIALYCAQHDWITHHEFIFDMAQLISQHSIGIGAAGTSALERACLGLPSIIIPIADNQRTIASELHAVRAGLVIETSDITSQLADGLQLLDAHYSEFRHNGLVLADGLGTNRVVHLLKQLLHIDAANTLANTSANTSSSIALRMATKNDIHQVYQWQCLPQTRQYALEPRTPTWLAHEAWMLKQLDSLGDYFYIIEYADDSLAVGVVRMNQIAAQAYQLSIYVDPQYHHQGIATAALAYVDAIHFDVTLHATVLIENSASQQLFCRAQYQRVAPDTFIRAARWREI